MAAFLVSINFPPLFALWAMEWAFVWFTWSIFFLRKEKCKYARGLLAVESSCWSAREKLGGKTGWGMENVKQEGGKTDLKACSRKSI